MQFQRKCKIAIMNYYKRIVNLPKNKLCSRRVPVNSLMLFCQSHFMAAVNLPWKLNISQPKAELASFVETYSAARSAGNSTGKMEFDGLCLFNWCC